MTDGRRSGPAILHPSVFVAPGAVVTGDVTLGRGAGVWFNTVVRGDTAPVEVGEETNLQDNSVVHVDAGQPARIGARVTVGHRAIVHGCVIGDDCLIGMGSVVLSGARIGNGCLLGAASLVKEGQVIPSGSLALGSPARVVGAVTDQHRVVILRGSAHYVELARSYMRCGLARHADARGMIAGERPPMSLREWGSLLRDLRRAPARLEAQTRHAGARSWTRRGRPSSAWELLGRTRDDDRTVRLPCVERLLAGEEGILLGVAESGTTGRGGHRERPPIVFAQWGEAREALVRRLAPLGEDQWRVIAGHPTRGPFTLAELVREWADEDLERGLALLGALRGGA